MNKVGITLQIDEDAKKAVPGIMKSLGLNGTQYSTKPKERLMLWGDALKEVAIIMSKIKSKGYDVKKITEGVTPSEKISRRRLSMSDIKKQNIICPKCGHNFDFEAGMGEQDGWQGIRPRHFKTPASKQSQNLTTLPSGQYCVKNDRVRVVELKGREIGVVKKVYMDGSLDVVFPSGNGEDTFVDKSKNYSVQKIGFKTGDRLSGGKTIKTLHVNKDIGVYAATIINDNGTEEAVVLENVEQI